jgi:hypothetical protein
MKIAALIAITVMAVGSLQAKTEISRDVTVYYRDNADVPCGVRTQALLLAANVFGTVGVKVHFHAGVPPASDPDAIAIEFTTHTPANFMPGALAYALPYEGVHIRIFWDRIGNGGSAFRTLQYVLLHEITHILQGVARHSDEGIMKAHWGDDEKAQIRSGLLRFTPNDIDLIHSGMGLRLSRGSHPAGSPMTVAAVEAQTE